MTLITLSIATKWRYKTTLGSSRVNIGGMIKYSFNSLKAFSHSSFHTKDLVFLSKLEKRSMFANRLGHEACESGNLAIQFLDLLDV